MSKHVPLLTFVYGHAAKVSLPHFQTWLRLHSRFLTLAKWTKGAIVPRRHSCVLCFLPHTSLSDVYQVLRHCSPMGGAYSGEIRGGLLADAHSCQLGRGQVTKTKHSSGWFCLFNQENPLRNENRGISPSLWDTLFQRLPAKIFFSPVMQVCSCTFFPWLKGILNLHMRASCKYGWQHLLVRWKTSWTRFHVSTVSPQVPGVSKAP